MKRIIILAVLTGILVSTLAMPALAAKPPKPAPWPPAPPKFDGYVPPGERKGNPHNEEPAPPAPPTPPSNPGSRPRTPLPPPPRPIVTELPDTALGDG